MDQPSTTKRRRVYSLQPNTLPRTVFAKKYVNNLLPALKNIGNKPADSDHDLEKLVRYEVDNALVSSAADGFAWSRALKANLHSAAAGNVGRHQNSSATQKPSLQAKFSANPNSNPTRKNLKTPKRLQCNLPKPKKGSEKESEEMQFSRQLTNLRTLLPGGNEMEVNELLTEVGSYLMALELQVNVLRCLVETH